MGRKGSQGRNKKGKWGGVKAVKKVMKRGE